MVITKLLSYREGQGSVYRADHQTSVEQAIQCKIPFLISGKAETVIESQFGDMGHSICNSTLGPVLFLTIQTWQAWMI